MRKISVAVLDDAPHCALLVRMQIEAQRHAGQRQVRTVVLARRDVVEVLVVILRQAISAGRVGPDPAIGQSSVRLQVVG